MWLAGHALGTGNIRNINIFFVGKPEEKNHFGDPGRRDRITCMWIGIVWLKIRPIGVIL
jgi:hypothetical protein